MVRHLGTINRVGILKHYKIRLPEGEVKKTLFKLYSKILEICYFPFFPNSEWYNVLTCDVNYGGQCTRAAYLLCCTNVAAGADAGALNLSLLSESDGIDTLRDQSQKQWHFTDLLVMTAPSP